MKNLKSFRWFSSLIIAVVIVLCTGIVSVQATTIEVNTTTDEFNTGAGCSLREAIQSVNAGANMQKQFQELCEEVINEHA